MSALPVLNILGQEETDLGPIVGIDLGTTHSLVAVLENGAAHILANAEGKELIPSVVSFPRDGAPVSGFAAVDRESLEPARTIRSAKRLLGRALEDLQEEVQGRPYAVVNASDRAMAVCDLGDRQVSPVELAGRILAQVRSHAAQALELDEALVTRAVITVPAYFDDVQRSATREAARLAGLQVMRILNEPTAAALAYGLQNREAATILVYDLGGGTFDASLLRLEDGVFRVLATAGDTCLGGDDFDRLILEEAAEAMVEQFGFDPRQEEAATAALRMAAEACKCALSDSTEAELVFHEPEAGVLFRKEFSRAGFEAKLQPLLERTLARVRQTLQDGKIAAEAVDEVILVGGSTRIPAVEKAVTDFFGRPPRTDLNPDTVVAQGAAIQADILAGGEGALLLDVTPLSLGLETAGGAVSKIIHRNTSIPARAQEEFTTGVDGQTAVKFHVLQGERELVADCRSLGEFVLSGLAPVPAGLPRLAVEFLLDADGVLRVSAKETKSGQEAAIEVRPKHGLTDAEVEIMLSSAWEHAEEDLEARRMSDLRARMEQVITATAKHLETAQSALQEEDCSRLMEALAAAQSLLATETTASDLQAKTHALEEASQPLAVILMQSLAEETLAGKALEDILPTEPPSSHGVTS